MRMVSKERYRAISTMMLVATLFVTMGAAEVENQKRGKRGPDKAPKVGDDAPAFKLKRNDDDSKEVELASFKGKKPVVLIFGSYT